MIAGATQETIKNYLNNLLQNDQDVFLVEVKANAGNDIKVFIDDDNGITIEKCVQINRALYKRIEEDSLFENGNFSLEVSSPGVEEPLKLMRQYKKNVGRNLEILLNDGSIKEGRLFSVNDEDIVIEETEGKGKKARLNSKLEQANIKQTTILFNQIKQAKVLLTF